MMQIETQVLTQLHGSFRHEHLVRRHSRQLSVITELRRNAVPRATCTWLVSQVCADLDVPGPEVTFHRGRGPHTGYCQMPRQRAIERADTASVESWEISRSRDWPQFGMLRFGDPTSLGTVAHELGHHLVNHCEPATTTPHGKRWVHWFDVAAGQVARHTWNLSLDGKGDG
jgi:hypothetical protein